MKDKLCIIRSYFMEKNMSDEGSGERRFAKMYDEMKWGQV
jgi:hypothetical protein